MPQIVQKMFGSSTTSADAVASVDVQEDGVIEGVLMAQRSHGDATNEGAAWEVSFASVSAFTSNDTRASICGTTEVSPGNIVTTGGPSGKVSYVPMEVPVNAGERIYLHTTVTGTPTTNTLSAWLYIRNTGGGAPRSRRPNFRT